MFSVLWHRTMCKHGPGISIAGKDTLDTNIAFKNFWVLFGFVLFLKKKKENRDVTLSIAKIKKVLSIFNYS